MTSGPKARPWPGAVLGVALAALLVHQSTVVIQPDERGILLTFERAAETVLDPGLQLIAPGAQAVTTIRPTELKKLTVLPANAPVPSAARPAGPALPPSAPRYFLTADENLVTVEASIQYRIKEPHTFLFGAAERDVVLRLLAEDALSVELLATKVDDVLSQGRAALLGRLRERLQGEAEGAGLGVLITAFLLGDVVPPGEAIPAFQDVSDARAEAEQMRSRAQADARASLVSVRGEANKLRAEASSYQAGTVARARGEVARFEKLSAEYAANPALIRRRLSLEAQQRVLPRLKRVHYDGRDDPPKIRLRP